MFWNLLGMAGFLCTVFGVLALIMLFWKIGLAIVLGLIGLAIIVGVCFLAYDRVRYGKKPTST